MEKPPGKPEGYEQAWFCCGGPLTAISSPVFNVGGATLI